MKLETLTDRFWFWLAARRGPLGVLARRRLRRRSRRIAEFWRRCEGMARDGS